MISDTKGIVLHTINFSETSVIAKIYTERFGMQSYMVNGVRKTKPKFKSNLLQPLSLVELIAHQKQNRDIQRISDISSSPPFETIPYDVAKSAIAFFIAEVLYKSIREEETNENLFPFLFRHIELLDLSSNSCKQFHHFFLMQLSRQLGFFPHGMYNDSFNIFDLREGVYTSSFSFHTEFISGREAGLFHEISCSTFETHHLIKMNVQERKQLLKNILFYYELHVLQGAKINSFKVLEDVMN